MLIIGSGDYVESGYDTIYDITINDFIYPDQILIPKSKSSFYDFSKLPNEIKFSILLYVFKDWMNASLISKAYDLSMMSREVFYFIYFYYKRGASRFFTDKYEWRNMLQLLKKIDRFVNLQTEFTNDESFYGFEITHIRPFKNHNITPYSTFMGISVVEYMSVYDNYILVKTGPSLIDNALIKGKLNGNIIEETKIMLPCVILRIVDPRGQNHFVAKGTFSLHGSWNTFGKLFKQIYGKYSSLLIEIKVKRGDIYTCSLISVQ